MRFRWSRTGVVDDYLFRVCGEGEHAPGLGCAGPGGAGEAENCGCGDGGGCVGVLEAGEEGGWEGGGEVV